MDKKIIQGEAPSCASIEGMLVAEQFLNEKYLTRRNVLSGKVEYTNRPKTEGEEPQWQVLTQQALNSIIIQALREGLGEECNPKADITMLVNSDEVKTYNPINAFLEGLPRWDGQNHVAQLFARLPGLSTEQTGFLCVWLRSMVAHWLQMDLLHANEVVPTLIGAQGCGKSTFVQRLLPPQLREYYLDHLNLSNKFDKEMALTNNLLVNLDELDAIRPSQHASLKQTLSKSKVNGRVIYGSTQQDRKRYASFVATTNNPHPLTDATGSRRYICLTIPKGQLIDNTGDINYDQLYAQVLYELRELKAPYWFTNNEVMRIQELNINYMEQKDIAEIVSICFRKPTEGETVKPMNCMQMLEYIKKDYPTVPATHSTKVQLGLALKELGYEHISRANVMFYKIVPLKVA